MDIKKISHLLLSRTTYLLLTALYLTTLIVVLYFAEATHSTLYMGLNENVALLINGLASALIIAYLCCFLQRYSVDGITILLFVLTALLSLRYFHISDSFAYTNDLDWHINFITYIRNNWTTPYDYSQWTSNHPPVYYYIGAIITRINEAFIGLPERTILRFFSWASFMVFHVFNLLTLRRVGFTGKTYYACALLVLLWPANHHFASKLNSEALYYALASIAFYYSIIWYQDNNKNALMKALIATGIALTVRSNGVIILSWLGVLMLVSLWQRRLLIREFFSAKWLLTISILLACIGVCIAGLFVHPHTVRVFASGLQPAPIPLSHYLSLTYAFEYPFNIWSREHQFLEYLLKTSVFSEYTDWRPSILAILTNYFIVAIFWYSILPWIGADRQRWRGMLPYILYLLFSLVFVVYFSRVVKSIQAQDARYIYPALICMTVLYGKSLAFYTERGIWQLRWLGIFLAVGLITISSIYFWNNVRA